LISALESVLIGRSSGTVRYDTTVATEDLGYFVLAGNFSQFCNVVVCSGISSAETKCEGIDARYLRSSPSKEAPGPARGRVVGHVAAATVSITPEWKEQDEQQRES
jgi:hypothetical protein